MRIAGLNRCGGLNPKKSGRGQPHSKTLARRRKPIAEGFGVRLSPAALTGFTLMEVVISASLMAMIIVSGYLCLNAAMAGQKLIEPRVEIFQNARVAMALMTADLRNACPLTKDSQFLGMHRVVGEAQADNLDFATHNYTPRHAREGDFCEVSFFLEKDPASGDFSLLRRRNPTIGLDPLAGGQREEIAKGLLGMKFEYYDGLDWYSTWGDVDKKAQSSNRERSNLSGMPAAVRVTLWFDSNPRTKPAVPSEQTKPEPPLVFQSVARLNLANSPQRGTAGGSSPDDTFPAPTPAAPANPTEGVAQ
jgi:hypothetical protein